MVHPLQKLINGFERFRTEGIDDPHLFSRLLTDGQKPEVMVIGCADSRVDPGVVTSCQPGELFILRNVAAIVPPYGPDEQPHAASAAIEFGVRRLNVKHILVLGHQACGGIRALAEGTVGLEFMAPWVGVMDDARRIVAGSGLEPDAQILLLEQAAVLGSLRNLLTFPWIEQRVVRGELTLHGWWFNLAEGRPMAFDPLHQRFVPLSDTIRPIDHRVDVTATGRAAPLSLEGFVARAVADAGMAAFPGA
ncbi:MAG TPA: carbonic anhydrase [Geminicoccus sp.]|uniref:carbonic anhydrase n=1 Tax=Geminicoccus sp. TaxID=2024832 RepID=UPI002B7E47CA|nr:carbonic anhydrase [Geminicoccus sp.]HWL68798.1 carbonic anhydrase [Geminicoccus sp.]